MTFDSSIDSEMNNLLQMTSEFLMRIKQNVQETS